MTRTPALNNQSGATAIEFAMILPIVISAILGAWQFSYIGWAQHRLENAVRQGSRVGITGAKTQNLSRQQIIENAVKDAMSGVAKDSGQPIIFASKAYPTFSTMNNPGEPYNDANGNNVCDPGETFYDYDGVPGRSAVDIGASGTGSAGDVVRYEVTFPLDLFVPLVNQFFGQNHRLNLTARTVVRNEMFGAGAAPTAGIC
jgi:Flp pilus assembly pilin Flp